MAKVKLAIADIDDQSLYLLSELENKFSIPIVDVIQAAARYNEPIKLCIQLHPEHKAELIESDGLMRSVAQVTEVLKGNKNIRRIDFVPRYRLSDAFALVIKWPIIKKLLSKDSVTSSVFKDVYVRDKNHQSSIQIVSTESYAKVLGLASNIIWQFAAFHVDIPSNKFLPPAHFNLSKDNLLCNGQVKQDRFLGSLP